MKSGNSIQIEAIENSPIDLLRGVERPNLHHHWFEPPSSLIDTPSIAVSTYDLQYNNISTKKLSIEPYRIQLLTTDNEPTSPLVRNPNQRLPVEPYRIQLSSLN